MRDFWEEINIGNVVEESGVWYRVNNKTGDSLYYYVSLQAVSSPYNGLKIIVPEYSTLSDRGYNFVKEYTEEIDSHQYAEIPVTEIVRTSNNLFYNNRVDYVYYYETTSWFIFKEKTLFLWSKKDSQWGLRMGESGFSPYSEIEFLNYLDDKITDKLSELTRKGDPQYWTESFSRIIYEVSSNSLDEFYFKYSNSDWLVSKNQKDWVASRTIFNGDSSKIGHLSDSDKALVLSLNSKNFNDGLELLLVRDVIGYLNTL